MKCGLETTRVTADAGTESAVPRSEATRQSLPVSVLDLVATRAVSQRAAPLRGRWNWRGRLSSWDTNATGWQNITPFKDWLAQPHQC